MASLVYVRGLLGEITGLSLPDLSTVRRFERSKQIFHAWWGLPQSAYECRPWPDGTEREPLVRTDLSLLGLGTHQDAPITNRERKRALANSARSNPGQQIEWPGLISEKRLQLDFRTELSLSQSRTFWRRRGETSGILRYRCNASPVA